MLKPWIYLRKRDIRYNGKYLYNMKRIFLIFGILVLFVSSISAQTNIINISNSRVIINNYTISQPQKTNIVQQTKTIKVVAVPREVAERIQWEKMLEQRRRVAFRSFLRTYN